MPKLICQGCGDLVDGEGDFCSECIKLKEEVADYPEGEDLDHPENPNSTYSNEIANQNERRR